MQVMRQTDYGDVMVQIEEPPIVGKSTRATRLSQLSGPSLVHVGDADDAHARA